MADIQKLLGLYKKAKNRRSQWEELWEEIYELMLPMQEGFFSNTVGEENMEMIYDETAVVSIHQHRFNVSQVVFFHLLFHRLYRQLVDIGCVDLPLFTYQFSKPSRIPTRTTTVVDHGHSLLNTKSPDTLLYIWDEEVYHPHE